MWGLRCARVEIADLLCCFLVTQRRRPTVPLQFIIVIFRARVIFRHLVQQSRVVDAIDRLPLQCLEQLDRLQVPLESLSVIILYPFLVRTFRISSLPRLPGRPELKHVAEALAPKDVPIVCTLRGEGA